MRRAAGTGGAREFALSMDGTGMYTVWPLLPLEAGAGEGGPDVPGILVFDVRAGGGAGRYSRNEEIEAEEALGASVTVGMRLRAVRAITDSSSTIPH